MNILLIFAVMSTIIPATLTLPGIVGIVLTVGMAVDANVLIFTRIREELTNGLSPQQAIDSGYNRAFTTILDANLTTFLVALVLFFDWNWTSKRVCGHADDRDYYLNVYGDRGYQSVS